MTVDYTLYGWAMIFARTREKSPGSLMGKNWQSQVAKTSDDFHHWMNKDANANVGLLLGPTSGVIDVEYDTEEGEAIVEGILKRDNPKTPTYRSGKSIHRLYKWDANLPETTVPRYKGIEWRINSKNLALQSILPPSIHPSGKRYEWLPGLSPAETPVRLMPFELRMLCDAAADLRVKSDETDIDERGDLFVKHGARQQWLLKKLYQVANWGLSESQLMVVANVLDAEVAHFDDDEKSKRLIDNMVRGAVRKVLHEETEKSEGQPKRVYSTEAITADELLRKKIVREFAVEDIMVMGEPMIVGGPTKSLKTSIMLELTVSIATGRPFLGKFKVPEAQPVMVISGESGELTIQQFIEAIRETKELDTGELKNLLVSTRLPKLTNAQHVDDLVEELNDRGIKIVVIDPLYRSLQVGDGASNVYSMGQHLELLAEKIHRAGITPILLHHFRKQGKSYDEAPDLEDLSQSGIAEFGRQFLLMKRHKAFEFDGNHTLWMQWGGSAGHQGMKILEAYTGTLAIEGKLVWQHTLKGVQEYKDEKKRERETKKEMDASGLREEIVDFVFENPGCNQSSIETHFGGSRSVIRETLNGLVGNEIEVRVGPRKSKQHFLKTAPAE